MKPTCLLSALLPAALLAGCATTADYAAPVAVETQASTQANDLQALVAQVDIPYETFTLDNGLTVIVHTDRKAPLVGVTTYYRVGSKHEPRGRTGFAHLFEHIMFNGSENVDNFDVPLEGAGSTPTNGSTWFDRTNYVETVPTGAIDRALMMEADRMGYLLGAVTQEDLDRQRGVVQNEKRQGDNQPYGLADYRVPEVLLPVGHPYRHSTIGSMADLSAASLEDVRSWFRDHYGPNNVVLALAGDIDAVTAREKVQRWFGDIPRGPDVPSVSTEPVTLAAPVSEEMADQVSQVRVTRNWTGPGLNHPDAEPLEVGMSILGGLYSSRLDNAMVYGEEVATRVSAQAQTFEQMGFLSAEFDLIPDGDRAAAEVLFLAEIDRLVSEGPSEDEVRRAATQVISGQIRSLERVGGFGGKGMELAEGLLFAGDPEYYRKRLERIASLTPADVQAAMQRWLTRPAYTLAIVPGERTLDGAAMGGWGDEATNPPPAPDAGGGVTADRTGPERAIPEVGAIPPLDFPTAERAMLSNGIPVTLVQRDTVPAVMIALTLDAGSTADSPDEAGRHQLMMDMLSEGTTSRGQLEIVIEQEELGADISAISSVDFSRVFLSSLTSNLPQALDLMADIALNPAFEGDAFDRMQAQRLAEIADGLTSPGTLAGRAMGRLLFGPENPYAMASTNGDAEVIDALTAADMRAEHDEWFRPDLASFTVVGDIDMASLLPLLEEAYGSWQAPATPPSHKAIDAPVPAPATRLVVVDRPNSPQSVLVLGRLLPLTGMDQGKEPLELANEVIGNGFLSRLNNDLRETRGWTYGVGSSLPGRVGQQALVVSTAVQADRTADSITVILDQMAAFPFDRPVTDEELQRVTLGNIRGLPNRFETNGQLLGALLGNQLFERPDDYQERLPEIYSSITADAINDAAARYLQPDDLAIVVVGDRAVIDEQLEGLGLAIEYWEAEEL
ncbi:M16 family metallopeptidase [Alteraurantiacibacter aquimixticola]|uniref:Insulinase family protein n=1 Tax=Alteraurantiacibacter aquimixticola TaxID=2489173 RepID=A0A4T3F6L2_9SPHN|nr:pitrilysin family protein [Alteraurantiacibacter aquimixticola]TIX51312.1 insulinase family protein [Alteraurantiacibacter aquimixticola]